MEERRRDDHAVAILAQKFDDFLDRYERDSHQADICRRETLDLIKAHDNFISKIEPVYSKGMIAVGAFVLGLVGLMAVAVWTHIKWG
jgi:hypothetical protein